MLTIFDNFGHFQQSWQFWQFLTIFTILTIEKTNLETCDIWDTDYNSDNWEHEFMTIFVTWQLILTLDSIRNSCDVLMYRDMKEAEGALSFSPSAAGAL